MPTSGCQNDFPLQTPGSTCIYVYVPHLLCQISVLILLKLGARQVTEGSLTQEIAVYGFRSVYGSLHGEEI